MFIARYILENYVMLFELGGLVMVVGLSVHITEKMKKTTSLVIALIFIESLFFHLEMLTQESKTLIIWRPLLTASIYAIYPIILLCVMNITVMREVDKRKKLLLFIPEAVSIPLYFTSQWTHLIFYFTSDNRYMGSALSKWPYYIFFLYAMIFLYENIKYFRGFSAKERFFPMYIIGFPLIGIIYYLVFREGRDYSGLFSSSLLVYYIFIYIHMAKLDPLTGLLNRQSYYKDIKIKGKTITAVMSVDMNNLKYLNDTFGHEAGDKALKTIASIFKANVIYEGTVYRIGGDEFVFLYTGIDEEEVKENVIKIRQKIEETEYRCAFGYCMLEKGKTIDEALSQADKKMYENKAAMKNEHSRR